MPAGDRVLRQLAGRLTQAVGESGTVARIGGDVYAFYAPQMNAAVAGRLALENRLRVAILEEQFVLHYQPKRELAGGRPEHIDLEITESMLMEDIEGNIRKLRAVREMGMKIAIDDFGTGYSSLAYIARLPIDALKIDRSFVSAMADHADNTAIVSTIISLAHSLKLKVIAKGVETEEQANLLRLLRCDEMQGYLFSKPLPRDQIEALLRAAQD